MSNSLASTIDHTILKADCTVAQIEQLCAEAVQHSFASVCILPTHVLRASELLKGSGVAVCTVVGFPLGGHTTAVKNFETLQAIEEGATEIDVVANISALKSNNLEVVQMDLQRVVAMAHDSGAIVKVIVETCLLTQDEKLKMCDIVSSVGADFIKTSTGFSTHGATIEDVELLRANVASNVQVKASGGIRTKESAIQMINAGASRIGTSSGVAIVT